MLLLQRTSPTMLTAGLNIVVNTVIVSEDVMCSNISLIPDFDKGIGESTLYRNEVSFQWLCATFFSIKYYLLTNYLHVNKDEK